MTTKLTRIQKLSRLFLADPNKYKDIVYVLPALQKSGGIFWKYAKVELRPPTPGDIGPAIAQASKLYREASWEKLKQQTFRDMAINACVAFDIFVFFSIGCILYKGHIAGYQVEGGVYKGKPSLFRKLPPEEK